MKRRLGILALIVCMSGTPAALQTICAQDSTTIVMTGDIMLDRGVRKRIEAAGIDQLFSPAIDSLFCSSDFVIGNLECPATHIKAPAFKKFVFRAEPEWLTALRKHGFTHLNLANNHSIDQGRRGLTDTYTNIRYAGMTPIGAGASMKEAANAVLITDTPRPVYILSSQRLPLENFAWLPDLPSVSQEPMDSLLNRIRQIRIHKPAACIIISLHWGWEHTTEPTLEQKITARQLIDAGADALVCHHSHTLQRIEFYHDKPIYYSIGNFIFDQTKPINTQTAIVRLTITADTMKAETIPVVIERCAPQLQSSTSPPFSSSN